MPKTHAPRIALILAAAGTGTRFGGKTPKQFLRLGKDTVFVHALRPFAKREDIAEIVIVLPHRSLETARRLLNHLSSHATIALIPGGRDRQESIRTSLQALSPRMRPTDLVLIHDAARPLVTGELISRVIASAKTHGTAIPGNQVPDALKRVDSRGIIIRTMPREKTVTVQTPQAFRYADILHAHDLAVENGVQATDDAALMERFFPGIPLKTIPGEARNLKITTPEDLLLARMLLRKRR